MHNLRKSVTIVQLLLMVPVLVLLPCIAQATPPDTPTERLIEAAGRGDLSQIKRLLDQGISVNAKREYGWTALMEAAEKGRFPAAKLLIEREADVNARTSTGRTALMAAVMESKAKADVVQLLLDNGADVNARDLKGWTPLIVLVSGYNTRGADTVKLLLEKGADVNARTDRGNTALLEVAAGDYHLDVRTWYQVLWGRIRFALCGTEWGPMLPPGIRTAEVAKMLLEHGADIKTVDRYGFTALERARSRGAADIVKVLRAFGAK